MTAKNSPSSSTRANLPGGTGITSVNVLHAGYGLESRVADCTRAVQQAYAVGTRQFLASNDWVGGNDPWPGKRKYLYVNWKQNGFPCSGVVGEDDASGFWIPGWGPWGAAIYEALCSEAVGYSYAVRQNGVLMESGGAGWARAPWDVAPKAEVSPDQLITIGSASKTITAAAMLYWLQENKSGPGVPFYDLIEGCPYLEGVTPGEGVRDIWLQHLLTQSSGLDAVPGSYDWNDRDQLWDMIRKFISQPVNPAKAPPGTTYQYLNENFGLLRGIISYVAGMSYEEYVSAKVLKAAGMSLTNITGSCDTLYYAPGQSSGNGWDIPDQASWRSNGVEMTRFLRLLRGSELLGPIFRDAMFTTYTIPKQWIDGEVVSRPRGVKLGLYPGEVSGVSYSYHNGSYIDSAGAGSLAGIVRFDDDARTDVALLINTLVTHTGPNSLDPVVLIPRIYAELNDL